MRSDLDIAREATPKPITEIARHLGLAEEEILPHGRLMAKIPLSVRDRLEGQPDGKLVLVTAVTPTPKGEGKTTTTIGLGQALQQIKRRAMIAIREPSLGPCLGIKGGAAGGGYSQVLPMEEINLHFTGDLHAISAAHNTLSAAIDNHLHHHLEPSLNPYDISWRRTIDMNDRALRQVICGLGERGTNGVMREDGFEITASSEVMAVLCLSRDLADLKERLGRMIIGHDTVRRPVRASEIGVHGAMAALLKHAICPNLVQTIEGTPVFVHGGPFANIAHGCNSLIATKLALKLAEFTVTEAGFGADLGAEKFFDIKCRFGGLTPAAAVLVATHRAHQLHGIENIAKHVENIRHFHVPVAISINRFLDDNDDDLRELKKRCEDLGAPTAICDLREQGGVGGLELAEHVARISEQPNTFKPLYDLALPLQEKIEKIATTIYGAGRVEFSPQAQRQLARIETLGYAQFPVCMAKTPASLTDDPSIPGRPQGFTLHVNSAKVSAGAGFVVVYTGKVMTMPGLPREPAALQIDIDEAGNITGLF